MLSRKSISVLLGALVMGLSVAATIHGSEETLHTNYLTFSGPVALPGVTLTAGVYVFERFDPTSPDIVVVRNRDRSRVYFLGFTDRADRPAGLRDRQTVTLGEARPGLAAPITAWYPLGETHGHRFVYETR